MPTPKRYTARDGSVSWRIRFRLGGVQTSLTFPTNAEADQFARDVEQRGAQWAWDNYQDETDEAEEMTLDQWAQRFLAAATVSPATLANYERDWRRRWKPHLGHLRLSKIGREDIVAALKEQTGAPKTIENAWGSLTTILKTAVADRHLDRSPHLGISFPSHEHVEKAEHRYMTGAELQQVIGDTLAHYQPLMWMLVGTGMRWGEATALVVGDVDLAAKTVRITRAWKRDRANSRWYVGTPKTPKSRRTVTLPDEVVEAVRPLVESRNRGELLFTNLRGEWVKHQTFYREHWRKACTANVAEPTPRIHDIRHSHVALLIAAGVGLPVIQARLGHEKITTTIDTYGHLLPDLQVAAADAASRVLGTPPAPPVLEAGPDEES